MSDKTYLGDFVSELGTSPEFMPYSKVVLWYDDEHAFTSGDDSGRTLEADLPFATQAMADSILRRIKDYVYRPYTARDALLNPAAELGDGVTVNGMYGVLADVETEFSGLMKNRVSAPADEEIDHEYPYLSPEDRALKRKVTLGESYYGTRITRAKGIESIRIDADGNELARAVFNADELAFYAGSEQAIYFDPEKKRYAFKGDVEITGNIKMAAGSITWTDGGISSGISSEQVNTIITSRLVSSPTIAGGLFYGRGADGSVGDTWLEIGTEGGPIAGGWGLMLKTYGLDPIFGVFNGSFLSTAFYAKGFNFFNIDADTETVTPYGTWDFEDATVKGFSRLENLDGNIELSAGNGLVSVNLDPDTRQIRFWFGPGRPVWALDASGLHAL